MPTPIIIANWKINLGVKASAVLAQKIAAKVGGIKNREVVLCPSFTALDRVGAVLKKTSIKLGSQDVFWEKVGSYTGEESVKSLRELGCDYIIVGHSERRQNLEESDEMIHKKIKACLEEKAIPIICVGETYGQRQSGFANDAIFHQLVKALSGIDLSGNRQLVIAYEPVWVIGSGRAIDPAEAGKAFRLIYKTLYDFWPEKVIKNQIRIVYGGSVDSKNADKFSKLEHFCGFLVGGSSLKTEEFSGIIKSI